MILEVTENNFLEEISKGFVVLDCYGDHCGPCKAMAPYYSEISSDLGFIRFLKCSTDQNPKVSKYFEIHAVPTLLFFRNGELVERWTGALDYNGLKTQIAKLLYGA